MPWSEYPFTFLALPGDASPGNPGWVWTSEDDPDLIPAELVAFYGVGSPGGIVAIELAYGSVNNVYQYRAVLFSAIIVQGNVFNSVVQEMWMLDPASDAQEVWWGRFGGGGADNQITMRFGPSGGTGLADPTKFYLSFINGARLAVEDAGEFLVDSTSSMQVDGSATIATLRHVSHQQTTASSNATTTYANLTNLAGVVFVAPESGCVTLFYAASLSNNTAAGGASLTPWVGTGGTIGAGTQVLAAADANACRFDGTPAATFSVKCAGHIRVTGLTPGATYNLSMRGRRFASGGTASFNLIDTLVVPEA